MPQSRAHLAQNGSHLESLWHKVGQYFCGRFYGTKGRRRNPPSGSLERDAADLGGALWACATGGHAQRALRGDELARRSVRVCGASEGRAAGPLGYRPRPDRQLASRAPLSARTGCAAHARRRPIPHAGRALRGGCTGQRVEGGAAHRRRRALAEGGMMCSSSHARRAQPPTLTLGPTPHVLARAVCAAMRTRARVQCAGECGAHAW